MTKPAGYWTLVFSQAVWLMKKNPHMTGDDAYKMARLIVDADYEGPKLQLDPPSDLELQ